MKRLLISAAFLILFSGLTNAQNKSVVGTVSEYHAIDKAITVNVGRSRPKGNYEADGSSSYLVFTRAWGAYGCTPKTCKHKAPKIVGNVKEVGRTVRVYYAQILSEHGFGYILKATKIDGVR